MIITVKIDSEVIAKIKNALCIIQLDAESIPRSESAYVLFVMTDIVEQVKRIDKLLPAVKFEG